MKKYYVSLLLGVVLTAGLVFSSSASAAPYCGIAWGSQPKSVADKGAGEVLKNIKTGRHACFDRMVISVSAANKSGYNVRYVSNVRADGSGQLISLAGGAKLSIIAKSPAYTSGGSPTYAGRINRTLPGVNLTGYTTFKDAKYAGSFEGQTTIGLGVRSKLPFRVFSLDNRIVIDVAHRW
ncbi:MAG TPA: hypothetical protein VF575_05680 [Candidatus Saccharimonadales bacterium]|jgi:hypothetical protein